MPTVTAIVKRHPLLTFFALVYVISWGGVLTAIRPGGSMSATWQSDTRLQFIVLAMLCGPSIAGILSVGLVYGRAGYRELFSRLLRWRVGARWYAVALLITPLLMTAVLLPFSLVSSEFLPVLITTEDKASLLLTGIMPGFVTGFFEELGWTGFAAPMVRRRHGVFATGLVVGLLWGGWHFIVNAWAVGSISGSLSLAVFLPLYFVSTVGQLTAFRVLMVWVYNHTESLLISMLMHASWTACTLFVLAPIVTGRSFLIYSLVWTAAVWVVVAAALGWRILPRQEQANLPVQG